MLVVIYTISIILLYKIHKKYSYLASNVDYKKN